MGGILLARSTSSLLTGREGDVVSALPPATGICCSWFGGRTAVGMKGDVVVSAPTVGERFSWFGGIAEVAKENDVAGAEGAGVTRGFASSKFFRFNVPHRV